MIVPQYWAEARLVHRGNRRQVTVRRFGWSDTSLEDAQAHAQSRVREALARMMTGEILPRREPKVPYNGAEGVPIREEIVDRQGEAVVTRNSYGARCLNTPNVVFADIDFAEKRSLGLPLVLLGLLLNAAVLSILIGRSWLMGGFVGGLVVLIGQGLAARLRRRWSRETGGEAEARRRLDAFLDQHPGWSCRLYRTPAGLRLMVTHQLFRPDDAEVVEFFQALRVDRVYAMMCRNQQCFRARVSAKPWRIGIRRHLRPRGAAWPIAPEHRLERQAWIDQYERQASGYAACSYRETLGSGVVHPDVRPVQEWHDVLSRATSGMPLA